MKFYITCVSCTLLVIGLCYFSYQIQVMLARFTMWFARVIGASSKESEHKFQKYVFMHRGSLVSKFYNMLNEQIITLGLKISGVTPFGYLTFWSVIAALIAFILMLIINVSFISIIPLFILSLIFELTLIRVCISTKMEKRTRCVMDAIDLIIPELRNGARNAILLHIDNYDASIRRNFKDFEVNVTNRKMSFSTALILLSDSLGMIFRDFAQKAVSYEISGDPEMLDIFVEIVETNRLRRDLMDVSNKIYRDSKMTFIASTGLIGIYAFFTLMFSTYVRNVLFNTGFGKFLVVLMVVDTVGVLCYITTLKSKSI